MGRFYKTTEGQFSDFMYKPNYEAMAMEMEAELENKQVRSQMDNLPGLKTQNVLAGYVDEEESGIASLNDELKSSIENYKKTGDKTSLDNAIKHGQEVLGKNSPLGKARYDSQKVFEDVKSGEDACSKLTGSAKLNCITHTKRYLQAMNIKSLNTPAEEFTATPLVNWYDEDKELEDNWDSADMKVTTKWENQSSYVFKDGNLTNLPQGYKISGGQVVDANGEVDESYKVKTQVDLDPSLVDKMLLIKTTNKDSRIDTGKAMVWAKNRLLQSPEWVSRERQIFEEPFTSLDGNLQRLEDLNENTPEDKAVLDAYESAKAKIENATKNKTNLDLTQEEEDAWNNYTHDTKDYINKLANKKSLHFIENKLGYTSETTTSTIQSPTEKLNSSSSGGGNKEEIVEDALTIYEKFVSTPTLTEEKIKESLTISEKQWETIEKQNTENVKNLSGKIDEVNNKIKEFTDKGSEGTIEIDGKQMTQNEVAEYKKNLISEKAAAEQKLKEDRTNANISHNLKIYKEKFEKANIDKDIKELQKEMNKAVAKGDIDEQKNILNEINKLEIIKSRIDTEVTPDGVFKNRFENNTAKNVLTEGFEQTDEYKQFFEECEDCTSEEIAIKNLYQQVYTKTKKYVQENNLKPYQKKVQTGTGNDSQGIQEKTIWLTEEQAKKLEGKDIVMFEDFKNAGIETEGKLPKYEGFKKDGASGQDYVDLDSFSKNNTNPLEQKYNLYGKEQELIDNYQKNYNVFSDDDDIEDLSEFIALDYTNQTAQIDLNMTEKRGGKVGKEVASQMRNILTTTFEQEDQYLTLKDSEGNSLTDKENYYGANSSFTLDSFNLDPSFVEGVLIGENGVKVTFEYDLSKNPNSKVEKDIMKLVTENSESQLGQVMSTENKKGERTILMNEKSKTISNSDYLSSLGDVSSFTTETNAQGVATGEISYSRAKTLETVGEGYEDILNNTPINGTVPIAIGNWIYSVKKVGGGATPEYVYEVYKNDRSQFGELSQANMEKRILEGNGINSAATPHGVEPRSLNEIVFLLAEEDELVNRSIRKKDVEVAKQNQMITQNYENRNFYTDSR